MDMSTEKFQLKEPSIRTAGYFIYLINSLFPDAEKVSKENLEKSLEEIKLANGDEILVSDVTLAEAITLRIKYTE
jgi:hypothetical protein